MATCQSEIESLVQNTRRLYAAMALTQCPKLCESVPESWNIPAQDTELPKAWLELGHAMQNYPAHARLMSVELLDAQMIDAQLTTTSNLDYNQGILMLQGTIRALKIDGDEGAQNQLAPPNSKKAASDQSGDNGKVEMALQLTYNIEYTS